MADYPKKPRIIGMCGRRGSGKDTATEAVRCFGYKAIAFAGGLKAMTRALLAMRGIPFDHIQRMMEGDLKEKTSHMLGPPSFVEALGMIQQLLVFQRGSDSLLTDADAQYLGGVLPMNAAESLQAVLAKHLDPTSNAPRLVMQIIGTEWGRQTISDTLWIDATMNAITAEPDRRFCISDARFLNEAAAIQAAGGKVIRIRRPAKDTSGDTHASEVELEQIVADFEIVNESNGIELFQYSVQEFYNQHIT